MPKDRTSSQPSVFLSHNVRDKRFARRLGSALADNGVRVWIDEAELKVGDSLLERISEGIRDMQYLGVILSPNSVDSNWVQKEVSMAMTQEITNARVQVLPILYKDCRTPLFLQDKLYADFRNPAMFHSSLAKLLDRVLPRGFKDPLFSAVRGAVEAEFAAYKALPDVETDGLDRFFTKDGSARKRIVAVLKRHHERKWVIDNRDNPSTAELLEIALGKVSDGRVEVRTKEYWYLRWYDLTDARYEFIYNKTNRQTYVLRRDSAGHWRVDVNIYPAFEGAA